MVDTCARRTRQVSSQPEGNVEMIETGKLDYVEIAAKNAVLTESLIRDHIANLFKGGHSIEYLALKLDMERNDVEEAIRRSWVMTEESRKIIEQAKQNGISPLCLEQEKHSMKNVFIWIIMFTSSHVSTPNTFG